MKKKIKEENKKIEDKKMKEDKKINEEIKTKINKFNENKIQEKKPIFKPITEQNMNMENRNRTFTVYTPNQNAFENNPFMKKYLVLMKLELYLKRKILHSNLILLIKKEE